MHSVPPPHVANRLGRSLLATAAAILLGACTSTAVDDNFSGARQLSRERLGVEPTWLTSDEARRQAEANVEALLARPLGADDAVRVALAYSPALQAMLYEGAASAAETAQAARLPNPVFAFERLARGEGGARELEITRTLSFSILDLLLLPSRLRLAQTRQEANRLALAGSVVQSATEARRTWVRAVSAGQSLRYVEQVKATADAGAELARRMQAVGNYSKLQRAREQAFSADAVVRLARARQEAHASREALIRALGLNQVQAARLTLPERLPDLPAEPRDEAGVARSAMAERLDVRMARSRLELLAREQGLGDITSVVNGLEIGFTSKSDTGLASLKGYDLSVPLPIFDVGDAARSGAQARYMAALNRTAQLAVDASSQLRETYGAYRTAYDIARHYRAEIVPLRKLIAEENILRYNGMLIGVFELLADSREQIESVVQAIDAERDFWLADAALQAALIGKPLPATENP
ncbi:MAG: TolC family protein [Burkholderiales bacterium]|nr:TolC family protein [Burkholderiales bacterium]